jgi:hypothetical protein
MVRFGFRVPSISKRIAARTSIKRLVKNKLGLRAPRGWGWITNPKKAAYNRVYNRTTRGCLVLVVVMMAALSGLGLLVAMNLKYPKENPMKPDLVEKLESLLEHAITSALESKKLTKLPVRPRREITHLMAKAAVAVYEGVVEGRDG